MNTQFNSARFLSFYPSGRFRFLCLLIEKCEEQAIIYQSKEMEIASERVKAKGELGQVSDC